MALSVRNITKKLKTNHKNYGKTIFFYDNKKKISLRPYETYIIKSGKTTHIMNKLLEMGILEVVNAKKVNFEHNLTKRIKPKKDKIVNKITTTNNEIIQSEKPITKDVKKINTHRVSKKINTPRPYEKMLCGSVFISICTYDRPIMLKNLIDELLQQTTNNKFIISVFNDNSSKNYSFIEDYPKEKVIYHKSKTNNGKYNYWKNINHQLKLFKDSNSMYFLQLDDDFMVCDDFINECVNNIVTHKKTNNKTMAMRIHRDFRANRKIWGTKNWVDGGTMYMREFLKKCNFSIKPISKSRWKMNTKLSSGVWEQLSRKMEKFNFVSKNTKKSLVYHFGYNESKMNPNARKEINIITHNFNGNHNKFNDNTRKNNLNGENNKIFD